jgi:hypothetical protein
MRRSTLAAAILLTILSSANARDSVDREAKMKAGYLVNFARLVEWPVTPAGTALTFCFLGGKSIHDALTVDLQKRSVGTRPVSLRYLNAQAESAGCDVLYLEENRLPVNDVPTRMHMLTVSDASAFARQGGVIQLFTENNRLRFRINVDKAKRVDLNVSSDLLQVAASVEHDASR